MGFWQERLPAIYEALSCCGLQGSNLEETAPGPTLECFAAHVCSELGLDSYKVLLEKLQIAEKKIADMRNAGFRHHAEGLKAGLVRSTSGLIRSMSQTRSTSGLVRTTRSSKHRHVSGNDE